MSLGLQYFFLHMFLIGMIIIPLSIWAFAKWHILGPYLKRKTSAINDKLFSSFDKSKPKIQKGAIIEDSNFEKEIIEKESNATNAQELLKIQKEKEDRQKEYKELERKAQEKDIKKNEKNEQKKLRKEAVQKEKEAKRQLKEDKNKEK